MGRRFRSRKPNSASSHPPKFTPCDKIVNVTVPDDTPALSSPYCAPGAESRESIQMQALIATIGEKLGMSIWLPKADRKAVLKEWSAVMVF